MHAVSPPLVDTSEGQRSLFAVNVSGHFAYCTLIKQYRLEIMQVDRLLVSACICSSVQSETATEDTGTALLQVAAAWLIA